MNARRWALTAGVVLTLAHLVILVGRIPVLTKTPGWFWGFLDKPFAYPWPLAMGTVGVLAGLVWAVQSRAPTVARWLVVFAAGVAIQHGLAWNEGRGLAGMRDRIVATGHAEFATLAVSEPSIVDLVTNYERRVDAKTLGEFAPSKPPGTLVFYVLTARVSQWVSPAADTTERLERLRTFAAWWWPVLAMLALGPLFLLARRLFNDDSTAVLACALYVLVPSVELITLHTDQVLFPLLAVTVAALTFTAFTRASLGLAFGAGVAASLAMFCSFPLGLGALLGIFAGLGARSTEWKVAAKIALFVLLGAVVADRIFAWCLGYDFMLRYERSVAHHVAWRGWNGRLIEYVHYALLGLGEFGLWLGVPVTLLAASQVGGLRSTRDAASFFATGLGLVLLALAVFGKTKGEVARLWLFLVPFACAAAANALSRFSSEPRHRAVVGAVFALEAAVLLATKRFQDFW